jgi:hypothetical protein
VPATAKTTFRRRIKFRKTDKGWGGIASDETSGDVRSFPTPAVEIDGYVDLEAGLLVEFATKPLARTAGTTERHGLAQSMGSRSKSRRTGPVGRCRSGDGNVRA